MTIRVCLAKEGGSSRLKDSVVFVPTGTRSEHRSGSSVALRMTVWGARSAKARRPRPRSTGSLRGER